jgi:DHA1 family multidrug resistance protein-like MFS transporter
LYHINCSSNRKKRAGWALGTLSTASIAGSLLGPMIGAYIEENIGLNEVFFIIGGLLMIAFITTLLFVKEEFEISEKKKVLGAKEVWKQIPDKNLVFTMFVTSFVLTLGLYSIEPIITAYIGNLSNNTNHVALFSGMAFSASGFASILVAPRLGKISDKVGPQKVMLIALIIAGIILIPQVFVKNPWQLMILRFFLGLSTAGLMPSVNSLVKRITPDSLTGRVFGFNMSAQYLGVFGGLVLGGQIAAYLGIRYVFFITSTLLLLNAVWVYNTVYRKLA